MKPVLPHNVCGTPVGFMPDTYPRMLSNTLIDTNDTYLGTSPTTGCAIHVPIAFTDARLFTSRNPNSRFRLSISSMWAPIRETHGRSTQQHAQKITCLRKREPIVQRQALSEWWWRNILLQYVTSYLHATFENCPRNILQTHRCSRLCRGHWCWQCSSE